ncbi:transposase [bacterium]
MNKKKNYDAGFKKKVILEIMREEKSMAEIASKYQVCKTTIRDWHRQFLKNMNLAIEPQKGIENYKEKLRQEEKNKENLYKQIGKLTTQLDWAKKKSEEYGLDY